jgi:hypothetical protein
VKHLIIMVGGATGLIAMGLATGHSGEYIFDAIFWFCGGVSACWLNDRLHPTSASIPQEKS